MDITNQAMLFKSLNWNFYCLLDPSVPHLCIEKMRHDLKKIKDKSDVPKNNFHPPIFNSSGSHNCMICI